ncbi:MAG TPA: globin [Gammaproteobacteria bacterium]|nr:globin [Gammaproteobacteria bacterium]
MKDEFVDVQNSYGRCLRTGRFIERFYEILMDSHPAMAPAFARTDMGRQRHALRRGISNAILYGGGNELVQRTVESVADLHSRNGRAPVPPNLYSYWMESLMQAVRESDPMATPALEMRWRQAIAPLIETFVQRY